MRLISKQVKANPDTFAPELEVVLRLPVEIADDSPAAMTEKEFQDKLGRDLFDLLTMDKK